MRLFKGLIQKNLYFLVYLKGLIWGFRKTSFSQFGEDIIAGSLLKGVEKGFFIDVGAYHPFHYSNTYLLYKNGWSGINIEPNPAAIALFNLHRRRDININSGIAREVTTAPYYVFNHQSCNTFSDEQKNEILKKDFISLIETKNVPCAPLQAILDTHAEGREIHFLNIDVEGMNEEVLRSVDWKRVRPRVICVEDDTFSFEDKSDIYALLTREGYSLHSKAGLSCLYVLQ